MINPAKLDGELQAAGIPIHGVSSDGRIDFAEATDDDRARAAAILAAHDPTPPPPTRAEKLRKAGVTEREAALALVLTFGVEAPRWAQEHVAVLVAQALEVT